MTLHTVPGLFPYTLDYASGAQRVVLGSSMDAVVSGVHPSAITSVVRGTPFDPTPPVVSSLVPATAQIGAANFTLHVHGTGFTPGAQILWNGSPEPTTFVSPTELTTGVNMATATTAGSIPVAVRSLAGVDSNALPFVLTP
jgi:hypothetical protein